jgi:hypothetical protein
MITVNMTKAKAIGHDIRRRLRAAEFEPLDNQISKQIPGISFEELEAQRQVVRDKYTDMQQSIDSATTPEAIKSALGI